MITHTGETAYALAARALAFTGGLDTVTITKRGTAFPRAIETVDAETSETYTVSYTTALVALALIAQELGAESLADDALAAVPAAVQAAIDDPGVDADAHARARPRASPEPGPRRVTAREGALKVREAARVLAEGYDVEYLLHGSAVPLDGRDHVVTLAPPDEPLVGGVATAAAAEGIGHTSLREPSATSPLLAQIPLTVRLQMLALRLAREGGHDPDRVITGAWADEALWRTGAPRGLSAFAPAQARRARSRRTNSRTGRQLPQPDPCVARSCRLVRERVVDAPRRRGRAGPSRPRGRRAPAARPRRAAAEGWPRAPRAPSIALARERRDRHRARVATGEPRALGAAEPVDLVQHEDLGDRRRPRSRRAPAGPPRSARARSGDDASATCTTSSASVTSSSVDRNASTRSCGSLLTKPTVSLIVQRRPPGQLEPTDGGVEGREELVGHHHVGAGETVHQGGLAGVRVTGDRRLRDAAVLSPRPLRLAGAGERLQLASQLRDAPADVLAVDLHLRLAPAEPGADAAARAAHRLAPAPQAGQQVVELRELHLGLALPAAGVQREDVEDQGGAIDHLHAEPFLERAELPGRELLVQDHGVGAAAGAPRRAPLRACPRPM